MAQCNIWNQTYYEKKPALQKSSFRIDEKNQYVFTANKSDSNKGGYKEILPASLASSSLYAMGECYTSTTHFTVLQYYIFM